MPVPDQGAVGGKVEDVWAAEGRNRAQLTVLERYGADKSAEVVNGSFSDH